MVPLSAGAVGGLVTDSGWYAQLQRPWFAPPGWVFGPVWTVLYVAMGTAAWLVWRTAGWRRGRPALTWYAVQLVLNAAWSPIFFGVRAMGWALAELVVLAVCIVGTLVAFFRVDRRAGMLLVPYLLWVVFAGVLNASLWFLNR
ncbi:MAG: TspO/MBR family protein [Myxococcota bacterium]